MKIQLAIKKLRVFYKSERRVPTYEEMTNLFGFASTSATHYFVKKLIEQGILEKGDKGKLQPKGLFAIPHLGTIKAGYPMPAFQSHDDSIDVYNYIHDTTGDIYFLTVSGDSMIEALIDDGDRVIIDPSLTPKNGDIVAAVVDGEWTLKYYFNNNGKVELRPANRNYPIITATESLVISGVLKAVIRKYI